MWAVAKFLRARASEHSSNFWEQFEQRPNFASTFKLNETIQYPFRWWRVVDPSKYKCWKPFWATSSSFRRALLQYWAEVMASNPVQAWIVLHCIFTASHFNVEYVSVVIIHASLYMIDVHIDIYIAIQARAVQFLLTVAIFCQLSVIF